MGKKIGIIILSIMSSGLLVFSIYQKSKADEAIVKLEGNLVKAEYFASEFQKAEERAKMAEKKARAAIAQAEHQRKIAEEALKKCK